MEALSGNRRRRWLPILLGVGIFALLPLSYWVFLREPPPPSIPPAPPPAPEVSSAVPKPQLMLMKLDGEVTIHRKGSDAGWRAATVGEQLSAADEIRTAPDATVQIAASGAYAFRLEPGTILSVEEIQADVSQFFLEQGMVTADVVEGERKVKVRGAGTDAVATSKGGAFIMTNNGQGSVAVGSTRGEVEVAAAGRAVIVRTGQSSVVEGKGPPSAPAPIPASLFLKVQWPEMAETNKRKIPVTGKTLPGSHVVVGSTVMSVEKDGRFHGVVTLREGHNSLEATSRDVGGRSATSEKRIVVRSKAPQLSTDKLPWEKR